MTMKPRTREELDAHAARLKERAKSGALQGDELQAEIDRLTRWGKEFHAEAAEMARYRRQRQYPREVR